MLPSLCCWGQSARTGTFATFVGEAGRGPNPKGDTLRCPEGSTGWPAVILRATSRQLQEEL